MASDRDKIAIDIDSKKIKTNACETLFIEIRFKLTLKSGQNDFDYKKNADEMCFMISARCF